MSVRGEFDRILGDTIACLREGDATALALARDLQKARAGASADLSAAAERVLALWASRPSRDLVAASDHADLEDAADRMLAISRIILGR